MVSGSRRSGSYRLAVRIQILSTATHFAVKGVAEAYRYSIDLFGRPPVASLTVPHLIAALLSRRLPAKDDIPSFHGDVSLAGSLIEHGQVAQNSLGSGQTVNGQPLVVGQGLTASTSVLNTGFGFNYFPNFQIG